MMRNPALRPDAIARLAAQRDARDRAIRSGHGLDLLNVNELVGFGAGGADGDPLFASVTALLHMDGADASTTFTDVKGHTFTANGNAQIDTAQSVFGGAAGLFDGSGDHISSPSSSDWSLTGDFCIEFRLRVNTLQAGDIFARGNGTATANAYVAFLNFAGGSNYRFTYTQNANEGGGYTLEDSIFLSAGVWYAFCIDRSGSSMKLFRDGTEVDSFTSSTSLNNADELNIGGSYFGGDFNGWIDEFRITKASRRQASYTVDASAFPDF